MSHTIRLAVVAGALAVASGTARAQRAGRPAGSAERAPISGPLSLADAVQRALRDDPDIRISERVADAALGGAISAHGAYDASIQTSVSHSRQNGLRVLSPTTAGDSPTIESALTSSVTSSITAQQRLPWAGLIISPQLSLASAGTPGTLAQSRAAAQLGVTVPLARDRWGGLSRNVERIAYSEADAAGHDMHQAAALGVYQAVTAYWSYVAAQRRLEVFIAAEEHAKQNLQQTTELVAADERPASDLVQLRGNVASKTSTRITAEQAVLEAWKSLAALLGVADAGVLSTPRASTDFPELPAAASLRAPLSDAELENLVAGALNRRPDLAAVSARVKESEFAVKGTDHLVRPVVNLVAQVGYAGLDEGWGVSQFVSPLYRNRSPLNATVQLSYSFAAVNSDAAGRARQAAAGLDEQWEARHAVERSVKTGVSVAIAGLRRALASAEAVHLSTQAAQETVDNEQRKFRLGSSTVFDIVLAEDNLTSVLLGDVAGRQAYAAAIARMHYEMGTLVSGERRALAANIDGLTRTPIMIATP